MSYRVVCPISAVTVPREFVSVRDQTVWELLLMKSSLNLVESDVALVSLSVIVTTVPTVRVVTLYGTQTHLSLILAVDVVLADGVDS